MGSESSLHSCKAENGDVGVFYKHIDITILSFIKTRWYQERGRFWKRCQDQHAKFHIKGEHMGEVNSP